VFQWCTVRLTWKKTEQKRARLSRFRVEASASLIASMNKRGKIHHAKYLRKASGDSPWRERSEFSAQRVCATSALF
jgi:hypothetical protein